MLDEGDSPTACNTCTSLVCKPDRDNETKLKLRVEQQLDVICSLKCEVNSQEKDNIIMRNDIGKIEESRSQLQIKLAKEQRARDLLNDRFDTLADNHNEMIVIMKEYKRECEELRKTLSSREVESSQSHQLTLQNLSEESDEKSKEIEQLNSKIAVLEEINNNLSQQSSELKKTVYSLSNQEIQLKSELDRVREESDVRVLCCDDKIEEFNKLEEKTENEKNKLKLQLLAAEDSKNSFELYNKELEEKLKVSQIELDNLRGEVRDSDAKRRISENRFQLEAEKVNKDLQVKHLREELDNVQQELSSLTSKHQSYKQYTNELLSQEREINKKLTSILS
ncbi:Coiled-coil domain-containing protein 89-like isoform X1 [Oopsacas minuta]|uniref:Coiled-coil domain-containing protein 89-like isoform X1 n=1 Tax=Oopsacas minuta TaxID=111878 RepID=A0AAV7K9C8_9METZ|nr:Coiled-coil domain-containing protein 89-like isoform X1 [Oopsacas minuta]